MERMTVPDVKVDEHTTRRTLIDAQAVRESAMEIYYKLKAYEDTGLNPENIKVLKLASMGKAIAEITEFEGVPIARLRELAEADKAGCVVVLPCKMGDTVYIPLLGRIIDKRVITIIINHGSRIVYCAETSLRFCPEDIGKTVFLTREDAESVLEEKNGNV